MPARFILYFAICALIVPSLSEAIDISEPKVLVSEKTIIVSATLNLGEKELSAIKNGIDKEFIFHVDLFRVWRAWPDEFVLGKVITRTLKCDPIKKEYILTTFDGTTLIEKRFQSCEPLSAWASSISELKLTNVAELEPDDYFVRVSVESRLRRLPPVIGYLLFFVKQVEFSIFRDSQVFSIGKGNKK
ncbi:MAG: DUF4390 domain-containing protein [Nitrospirae bacterium]|nr:DUF4390 domain-containing protein [Nitrospirota bacterium]